MWICRAIVLQECPALSVERFGCCTHAESLNGYIHVQILDKDAHKASHAVKLYMLELYCDELMDLLRVDDKKGSPDVRALGGGSA